jgi:hypothetical protein
MVGEDRKVRSTLASLALPLWISLTRCGAQFALRAHSIAAPSRSLSDFLMMLGKTTV